MPDEIEATQKVRLVDVFILGPFMVWSGLRKQCKFSSLAKLFMVGSGIATIIFNGNNYIKIRDEKK